MNKQNVSDTSRVKESAEFINQHIAESPRAAIILGSGLGSLVDHLAKPVIIAYEDIPNWGRSTAAGHSGKLVFGYLKSQPVLAMAGRFHRYEGWTRSEVTFPVRVFSQLGPSTLVVSNAAGGLHPNYRVGDIVVIHNHINLMQGHPSLRFTADSAESRVSMGCVQRGAPPYDPSLCESALATARAANFPAHPGTYLATLGPTYETRAEYRFFRRIGADVVGMSTVPEVIQAQSSGMRVLALSMVSNLARPDTPVTASHDEVLEAGHVAEPRLRAIVEDAVAGQGDG